MHSLIQPVHAGIYDWSQELQGVILSSFYWGYAITHLPGGLLGIYRFLKPNLFTLIFAIIQLWLTEFIFIFSWEIWWQIYPWTGYFINRCLHTSYARLRRMGWVNNWNLTRNWNFVNNFLFDNKIKVAQHLWSCWEFWWD